MKKYVTIAIILALAIVLGIVESFIPSLVPGFRIGLANIATLIVLYKYGKRDAFTLLMLRVFLVSVLIGRFMSIPFYMSFGGAIFAYVAMIVFMTLRFNIITTSLMGAIFHVFGQIVFGMISLNNALIFTYLPILLIISIFTGIFNGYIAKRIIRILDLKEKN